MNPTDGFPQTGIRGFSGGLLREAIITPTQKRRLIMATTKVAFIGCGGRNGAHVQKCMENLTGIEYVGFCDIDESRAYGYADRTKTDPEGKIFRDYREMLEKTKPDAIFMAVPPHCHGEIEPAIIDKGIPFLIEKPVALDMATAEKIEKLIKEKDLITAAGFQDRYQNLTQIMKDYIKDKKVGLVTGAWYGGIPGVWWWRQMETSGGQVVEQNIHIFDQARYLFGEPLYVNCAGARGIVDPEEYGVPGYNVHDYSSAVIKFKSGVVATIFTACYQRGPAGMQSGMNIYCKDAVLEYHLRSSLKITDAEGVHEWTRGKEQTGIQDEAFIHAVRTGDRSQILADYSEAVKSLRLTLACNESIETGRTIFFN